MECPKCKNKLMVDSKKDKNKFDLRCIRCGREFFIEKGILKQRKSLKIKKLPKGVTITKINGKIDNHLDYHLKMKKIIEQTEEVKRLNNIAKNMKRNIL